MPYIDIETADLEHIDTRILPFRAPRSANRTSLENVLVEPSPEGLLWAATDSYEWPASIEVTPTSTVASSSKQASSASLPGPLDVEVDAVRFEIAPPSATITLVLPGVSVPRPLPKVEYPDVLKFLDDVPQQNPVVLRVRSEHLRAALFATCTFNESTDEDRAVVALRSVSPGKLRVIAQWSDIADTSADVDATSDGPVDTIVNASFLLDLLDATDAQELTLLIGGPTEPLRVRTEDGFRSLVMPIHLGQPDLERKMAAVLGLDPDELQVNDDGLIPIDVDGHTITVRLLPSDDPFRRGSTVRFAAEVLADVNPTVDLLGEINDLNGQTLNCRVVHLGRGVHIYAENLLETLDRDEIVAICKELSRNASTFGPLLQAVHT